jgi:hypothetical protein
MSTPKNNIEARLPSVERLEQILLYFKIKFSNVKDDNILNQLAQKLNVKLGKTSFNKKVKLLLKAFDEFSKMRQVFSQKNYVDKAFEENNTVRRQSSSQATGVPEAQKVITIPSQFSQPQAQGLLTERDIDRTILNEIKLSRKLGNELGEEIKEITTQVLPEAFQETTREQSRLFAGERNILSTFTEEEQDAIMRGETVPELERLSSAGREYLNLVLGIDDDSVPSIVIENMKNSGQPPFGDRFNNDEELVDDEYEDDSLDFEDDSLNR